LSLTLYTVNEAAADGIHLPEEILPNLLCKAYSFPREFRQGSVPHN
jgi:hypothetical protein